MEEKGWIPEEIVVYSRGVFLLRNRSCTHRDAQASVRFTGTAHMKQKSVTEAVRGGFNYSEEKCCSRYVFSRRSVSLTPWLLQT